MTGGRDALMRFDNIRDMFSNTIVKDGQKCLAVDVARYGRDKTVFNFFEGLGVRGASTSKSRALIERSSSSGMQPRPSAFPSRKSWWTKTGSMAAWRINSLA